MEQGTVLWFNSRVVAFGKSALPAIDHQALTGTLHAPFRWVGDGLVPMKTWAEHPLVESARKMHAELERLGFTSEEALIEAFLQWRR